MTPPAATAPPPDAATHAPAPAAAIVPRARAPFSRPRHQRPPLVTGRTLAISVILHLLLLLAVLFAPAPERRFASAGPQAPQGQSQEMVDYMDVGEWGGMATDPSASLPEPAAAAPTGISAASVDSVLRAIPEPGPFPNRAPTGIPAAPAGQAGQAAAGQPGAAAPGAAGGVPSGQPGATGARRTGPGGLGPELGDPRLVVRPTAVPEAPVEDTERYRRHFEGRIQALNDSLAGEAERRRRATDWTITDRNGRKWGINERGPVVAGRNVPIPIPSPPRGSREQEEAARRERTQRGEIDRQEETIERERYLRERGRAIREREDREREEREKQGSTPP
ncbi:hypothetical protein [Longimicrobium sp.]|uniref:hypothetical protein n=1 Tax=Longimicrobium sp. TaxID=2029185 RepID=UPI003B3AA276